jgi:hypothetical protein
VYLQSSFLYKEILSNFFRKQPCRCSIVVSIPACHAGDPGSIPGNGDVPFMTHCEHSPASAKSISSDNTDQIHYVHSFCPFYDAWRIAGEINFIRQYRPIMSTVLPHTHYYNSSHCFYHISTLLFTVINVIIFTSFTFIMGHVTSQLVYIISGNVQAIIFTSPIFIMAM